MTTLKQVERPIRDQYTDETGYMDYEYSYGYETYYTARYGGWLESKLNELQPVTEMEKSIRELVQTIHDSGLDHKFVATVLGMFTAIAGIKGVIESKNPE